MINDKMFCQYYVKKVFLPVVGFSYYKLVLEIVNRPVVPKSPTLFP